LEILQVTTFFTEHGGVEKSVSDLSHALSQKHEVSVLCTQKGASVDKMIERVAVTACGSRFSLSGRPISFNFPQRLGARTVDVVHYHLPCPIAVLSTRLSSPRAKVKIATWHHDLVRHQAFNTMLSPFLDRFLAEMDAIIVTAPALIKTSPLLQKYERKCRVIPLGIDHHKWEDFDLDAVLNIRAKSTEPLVLYVGRLVYYKGCEVLLRAMRSVPRGRLVMVGTGPLYDQLLKRIKEYGLTDRVQLLGWQSENRLRALFQACDLFVLPSTLPTECFGLVQVEAMLCGKPVINTNLPTGVPWVSRHHETGVTVAPSDQLGLANAINSVIDDPAWRKELGANALERALSLFTLEEQTRSTEELLTELVSNAAGKPAVKKSIAV